MNRREHFFFKLRQSKTRVVVFWLFVLSIIVSCFVPLVANDKPIVVKYKGNFYFPAISFSTHTDQFFGGFLETEADYKDELLQQSIKTSGGYIVFPVIPFSHNTVDFASHSSHPTPPSRSHILGTDDQGRDVAARVIYGYAVSVAFAFLVSVFILVIALILGVLQGYYGGKTDFLLQRFIEVYNSIPTIFLLIIISSILTPNFLLLFTIVVMFGWTSLACLIRSEVLKIRSYNFVKSSIVMGISNFSIIKRHIIPNALSPVVASMPFVFAGAISTLTSLDFLGFGLPPGYPSLGEMLLQAKNNLSAYWLFISSVVPICFILVLAIIVGELVRDTMDVKTFS